VATRLGVPLISYAVAVESFDPVARTAVVHRRTERGVEVLHTTLPALLTVEKEIASESRAPLANLIRAARYQPELWSASEPVAFDVAKIGIKGSPTIVGKAYTPPPRKAGASVKVADKGVHETVTLALGEIGKAGVLEALK
jgi:electron transfer flavoprotein beta subunit